MLPIYTKFYQSISKGFRVTDPYLKEFQNFTDPDSMVDARVVSNADGRTDILTNGKKF